MTIEKLTVEEVVTMPERTKMQDGKLYVSKKYELAIHRCACGCGIETVTPIDKERGWTYMESPEGPTLHPSIGNQQLPCKSHYWVQGGKIVWC